MVLVAVRSSFAWFLFSCLATFLCLTSFPFPYSLGLLSIVQIILVFVSIIISAFIYGLNKVLMDDELTMQDCALIGTRATGAAFVYLLFITASSSLLVMFIGGYVGGLIIYLITAYAMMAQLNLFHSRISFPRVLLTAFLAWVMLYYLLKGVAALLF